MAPLSEAHGFSLKDKVHLGRSIQHSNTRFNSLMADAGTKALSEHESTQHVTSGSPHALSPLGTTSNDICFNSVMAHADTKALPGVEEGVQQPSPESLTITAGGSTPGGLWPERCRHEVGHVLVGYCEGGCGVELWACKRCNHKWSRYCDCEGGYPTWPSGPWWPSLERSLLCHIAATTLPNPTESATELNVSSWF